MLTIQGERFDAYLLINHIYYIIFVLHLILLLIVKKKRGHDGR